MLAAAAFCPTPPLLHPAVAADSAAESAALRSACLAVVADLMRAEVNAIIVVGDAPRTGEYPSSARGTVAGFGVDVALGRGDGPIELPLSLGLAAWLLDEAGYTGPLAQFGVARDEDPARCRSLGAGLADRQPRVGMLVMGDGSAKRDAKAPGSFDERAEPFDEAVVRALTAVDDDAISRIDPRACDILMVTGRASWQVAAGAAAARRDGGHDPLRGARHHKSAPYGVGYAVVGWHEHGV